MDYVIYSSGIPFNGETAQMHSLGGSESAAYFLARELAARGHDVKLFTAHNMGGTWDGVDYVPHGEVSERFPLGRDFHFYAENTPHDVLIIQRHPLAFHQQWASKINIWQLHDLALYRTAREFAVGASYVDAVTVVSQFHKEQVAKVYGLTDSVLRVVPNGVDADLYAREFNAERPEAFTMLYQSRPERGLEHLVRPGGIMEQLHKQGSTAQLLVCRYAGTAPSMEGFYAQIDDWCSELPNVTILGNLSKQKLADVQRTCHLLCYPTEFEEVSCITAMEAMHAGLPLLTSDCGALRETCEGSGTILLPLVDGIADEGAFVANVLALEKAPRRLDSLRAQQLNAAASRTWVRAADVLEGVVREAFARRNSPTALLKHYVEHSDIFAARDLINKRRFAELEGSGYCEIAAAATASLELMYAFASTPQSMREHYIRHTEEPAADFERELESFALTTRCRGVLSMLSVAGARTVLEHGCAHGHLTIAMARTFPDIQFTGIDFVPANIERARLNAALIGVSNVTFINASEVSGAFDVVVGAEILEHVNDYQDLLAYWRTLAPQLILTTPTGRWEWSDQKGWGQRRFHLHHFEKADLREIFAGHDPKFMFAPSGADQVGGGLGSWLTYVRWGAGSVPIGRVDYTRKHLHAAPRQTVSLCMIVCNAENTIGAALSSAIAYVDEVCIAVDPRSTDNTEERIHDVQARFPWVPIRITTGVEALTAGFAEARNRSTSSATGDWLLWMDADETLNGAARMWKYLRPSNHNAYGTPQHHYSADPPTVLTTDYPCRLFRNDRGVKFYGLVHEHPEDAPGKAIDHSFVISDVSFSHVGYTDEDTRRRRFERNFPLLLRDVKENPERSLNRYLMLRDMAQMAQFTMERTGGRVTREVLQYAQDGVEAFENLLKVDDMPTRMVVDSLGYYGTCVEVLGEGFNAEVKMGVSYPEVPALSVATSVKGRFRDRATFEAVAARVQREALSRCEEKYR